MRFISPKVDYAFKKIFGSPQSQEILISFLNAMIYSGEKVAKNQCDRAAIAPNFEVQ